jgi:predicted dehydrogenase
MWQAAETAGVKHMCAFNYRFAPANRMAREMIDAGELGEIRHFRGRYCRTGATTRRATPGAFTPPKRDQALSAT